MLSLATEFQGPVHLTYSVSKDGMAQKKSKIGHNFLMVCVRIAGFRYICVRHRSGVCYGCLYAAVNVRTCPRQMYQHINRRSSAYIDVSAEKIQDRKVKDQFILTG